jgi:type II secretory pathway pseudopilin PulG
MLAMTDTVGMTVVEVVIALAVLSVGLVALVGALPLGTSVVGGAHLRTTATFLAQQRLEQARSVQWTAAPAVDDLGGAASNGAAAVALWPDEDYDTIVIATSAGRASYPRFRRQMRITDCSVASCGGIPTGTASINTLRQVTVTVFFRPLSGVGTASSSEETVQLVTLIARRP